MATKKKKGVTDTTSKTAIVTTKVGNYEKHPFFVQKKEQAKAFLKKVGLPALLVKNTKA